MDLEQLLAEISKHPINTVLEKLKATPFYQPIFNDGHGVATKAFRDDLAKKEGEIAKLTKARDDLQTEFDKFKEKNPSASELQKQYTDAIATKDREIEQLKKAHAEERQNWRKNDVVARIRNKLAEVIDPEIADVRAEKVRDRIQLPDDSTVQIMQAGQQIPFAGDLDAQVAALVEEVKKLVPERLHRSDVIEGSGRDTAAGGSGGGKKDFFAKIRESVKKPEAAAGTLSNEDVLNRRLGHRAS